MIKKEKVILDKYPRKMNGGELWAKIEVLADDLPPLYKIIQI